MIRFEKLEANLPSLHREFLSNQPLPHIILDDFADAGRLEAVLSDIPAPESAQINKSRDYIFAKNKFEKSNFKELSPDLAEIYQDIVSDRFQEILKKITGEDVFVDKEFFGGGIHQGGAGSFLDMHVDFNYHPVQKNWFRNLNILLYLNKGWKPEHKGQLKLRNSKTGETAEIEPLFNRCVIMFTREYTFHGYDKINFPANTYRRSIATYAYTLHDKGHESYRSTQWRPESGSLLKKAIGANWPALVRIKNALFGIGTKNNR
jgi:Rps23 Pro-64 3,4-dihydroxylase Tpa1-like proline 4-hydroxylase